jgi:hypothetical protein
VVFFVNIQEVEEIEDFVENVPKSQIKKMKRCMLYVGTSRAMIRQYVYGTTSCAYTKAAAEYAKTELPPPGLL